MFKYSLVAIALIFVAVACNKKEEGSAPVEAAPEAMEAEAMETETPAEESEAAE
jgi:hypothetical protein